MSQEKTDDYAYSIVLGPATSAKPGEDWVLMFTPEGSRPEDPRRGVAVRMTPRVLQEIHTE